MFKGYYRRQFAELTGKPLTETDGLSEAVIAQRLAKRRLTIPRALADYYAVAGRHPINHQHNRLYSVSELEWQDDRLVFMEENQCIAYWGVPEGEVSRDDPVVWQSPNSKPAEWFAEDYRLSQFLMAMWRWQLTGEQEEKEARDSG